jgi:hypothetical protein
LKIIVENNRKIKRKEETECLFVLKTRAAGCAAAVGGCTTKKKGPNFTPKLENSKPFQGPPPSEKLKKKVGNEFSLLV